MTETDALSWLLDAREPWTRYRARLDLERRTADDPTVIAARGGLVEADSVRELMCAAAAWPGYPLKRHNDAAHPLYAKAILADFGLDRSDPGISEIAEEALGHFDGEVFETLLTVQWVSRRHLVVSCGITWRTVEPCC